MAALRRGWAVALAALVAAAMCAGMASAAVYEVGDKLGWTIMGSPDYGAWAASKKFSLGDTLGTPLAAPAPLFLRHARAS
uniref:Phytocyanin domain-containing protein n=1 Tax=Aegilops tauschii subsp. strangulata TaxID=200361 RepID=A0A453B8P5_AEGTS